MMSTRRLCIVSSHAETCSQWADYLLAGGWHVSVFLDIPDSLAYIQEHTPEVVLLDLPPSEIDHHFSSLPGTHSVTSYIPILNNPSKMEIVDCFRKDAADVLIKPFPKKALLKTVESAAKYRQLLNENRNYREQLEATNRSLQENLKILEMDQLAGRQIQQSMLPETPQQYGDYEIAHHIVPSLYLSGDFVGYHVIFDRYLVFYAADVSGHGASSAFLTIVLRLLLARILRRHIDNDDYEVMSRAPEGFIEYINRQILAIGIDKHLTMFAASIDMESNVLRYSVGAHMPMPVLETESETFVLPGKGKPLGMFEGGKWDVEERQLSEKFALTLTSDGVLEVVPGDDFIQKEQFILNAVAESDTSIESVCRELGITEMENAPDDVTVLTVRRGC